MEKQEYINALNDVEIKYRAKKRKLASDFALSSAKFKVGDVIKDSRWTFKIDTISVYLDFNDPQPIYHGYELKKDLTPRKDKNRVCIYGNKAELVLTN